MSVLRNLKLQYKVILLAVIPVLLMCIVASVINDTVIKDKLLEDTKSELSATAKAVLATYNQNSGEYFVNSVGDVWKGSYNVSLSETYIDELSSNTGVDVTFFWGDRRLVTSLKDSKGNKITGSSAGEFLVTNVLTDGNEVFTNRVQVEDEMYFGYYIPVYQQNSDEIVGMIFAGMPVDKVQSSLNLITRVFSIAIIIILALSIVAAFLVSGGIAGSIRKSIRVVEQLAEGNLNVFIDEKTLKRKDEVGDLSNSTGKLRESLYSMIGSISDNTMNLNASSQEMSAMAGQANEAMDNINASLKEILRSASLQVGNTQNVTENINNINRMLETTSNEVDRLASSADQMLDSAGKVEKSMGNLKDSNTGVLSAVEKIQKQTLETSISVERIQKAVSIISDIAEETNLLSLNASIEAARAGEAGKGFAVVAQQISKLADQSNSASEEISEIVTALGDNSNQTVEIMDMVQNAINAQSKDMADTAYVFNGVKANIGYVAQGVDNIRVATEKLGEQTKAITGDISALDEIAVNNEKTVEGTLKSGSDVLDVVSNVSNMSLEVSNSANEMANVVTQFDV